MLNTFTVSTIAVALCNALATCTFIFSLYEGKLKIARFIQTVVFFVNGVIKYIFDNDIDN